MGGLTTLEFSYKMLFKENKRATHPLTLLKAIGSSASAHVSIEYGIKGPTFGVVSACSTATHAIGLTYRMIREGLVDLGLAGAAEASLNWGATRAWQAMRVLSPDGLWPFAKRRNGTVLAEGAGILMLEEFEHAKARGAPILAELMGYGMTADAADMVNPSIDGASNAMQIALDDSGLAPSEIDYVNAHGTATTVNDINETRAIKRVFGNAANKLSISSTKSMHGHCLGAGGGIEAVAAIKAIGEGYRAADGRPRRAGSRVRPRLHAECRAPTRDQLRHVEFLRLRRPQRRSRVRPAAGLSRFGCSPSCALSALP